ncbi:hypothetical protein FJTKL_11263 [Diaporthe vaccinii]|uniref:Uncharacterized protein n=1 Tax=Diaporthe vaccinii TaxID=105482 RepID=A0ABR4EH71_9PEZI
MESGIPFCLNAESVLPADYHAAPQYPACVSKPRTRLLASTETKHQVQCRLLLNVVVRQSPAIFQLLASENETLLVWWDSLLVLNLGLDVVNRVRRLDLERDSLPRQGLHKDLHATTEAENQSTPVLELLSSEDQALLVGRNTLLVLDLGLHIVDGVRRLHLKGDCLACESLDEDLHTATQTEDEMEGGFLLNVVVGEGAAVLELLAGEDQALLVGGNSLLVLDLGLDVVDGIRRLDLEGDGLAGEGLDEDLHGDCGDEMEVTRLWVR